MKLKLLLSISALILSFSVYSDSFTFYDENGNKTLVNTETLNDCVIVHDSENRPLEICKLKPVYENSSSNNSTEPVIDSDRAEIRQTARRTYRRIERRND